MKVITIGRSEDNQIVLDDNQDMISRQHATLRIYETGKMEIVSTGSNGTFVNGFRIKPNMPYKVTRKDVISFAHVRQLDWALVPDPFRLARYGIIGTVVVALVTIAVALLWPEKKPEPVVLPVTPKVNVTPVHEEQGKTKEETPQEKPKEETDKEKVIPKKRFPSSKKKEKEEKKEEKEKPVKEEEANPQNQVF